MDELFSWTLPKLAVLVIFIWYLKVSVKSLSLAPDKSSALAQQLEMMAEVERTGRLIGALARQHEARLVELERGRAASPRPIAPSP